MIRKELTESECAERLDDLPYLLRLLDAEMHFVHARFSHESSDVLGCDAAAGQDHDASVRLRDQRPNLIRALRRRRCATRCQQAVDTKANEPLQRFGAIREDVECTMERHGERPSGGDEIAGAIEAQVSGHDAVRARTPGSRDLLQHRAMLGVCIDEIARAGTHEDENRNRKLNLKEVQIGSRAAMRQIGAKLNAVRATLGRRDRGVQRLHGRLDENGHRANLPHARALNLTIIHHASDLHPPPHADR